MTIERIEVSKRLCEAVVHGDTVYLCGQVADDLQGDIRQQTREVLANIDSMLARAGSDKSKLLTAIVYLKSMDDYKAMNEVWDAWTAPGAAPARTCVGGVALFSPDALVEITVSAAK
ncbi:MAG: RidA family protein [Betaproteobacteria bacterium]|nr:RidA family protein [Betaproteobacteria bacterium]